MKDMTKGNIYGSKNYDKLRSTIISMSYIMMLLAAVMSFIGFTYSEKFLLFLKIPENVLYYSVTYIRIIFVFSIGTVVVAHFFTWKASIPGYTALSPSISSILRS